MRSYLISILVAAGVLLSSASRAAYVPLGAIAGVDSPFPAAPVPTASDLAFDTGHVPFGSVLGSLTNGCGLYDGGGAKVSKTGTDCDPTDGLKKAIDYDGLPDRIVLGSATSIGLGLIVKEGHPEASAGSSRRDQNQIEDFDILLLDAATDALAMSWHYADLGSSDETDDAYFSGFFEESVVAAGSYYLSFRIPGYPSPGAGDPRGGSVEFLARVSARSTVPAPFTLWLLGTGLAGLALVRRAAT